MQKWTNGKCEHLQPSYYSNKDIDACYVVNNQFVDWANFDNEILGIESMSCLMTKPTLDNLPILSVNGGDDGEVLLMEVVCLLSDTKPQPWHQGGKKKRKCFTLLCSSAEDEMSLFWLQRWENQNLEQKSQTYPKLLMGLHTPISFVATVDFCLVTSQDNLRNVFEDDFYFYVLQKNSSTL